MKKNLEEIIDYIEEVRSDIKNYVQDKEDNLLKNKNNSNSWSPAQILEHLYKTEVYITELLIRQSGRAKKKNMIVKPGNTSFLHSLDEMEIEKVKEKIKAPEIALPDESIEIDNILEKMDASRTELNKVLVEFSEYDMGGIEFPHPTGKRMNMIQWVLFLGKHEERHFNQIKSLLGRVSDA